jgi:glycosyltransferase involved in cell wall biosynthesis
MPAEISLATPIKASGHRPRIAIALEYPLMQQGGTEVLVRELVRRLSGGFELLLVSGDPNSSALPQDFQKLICGHLTWDQTSADANTARHLAENLHHQNIQLAHFHFGGTYEWRSNRLGQSPVYHLARRGVPCLSTNHLVMEWLNCGVHPRRSLGYKLLAQVYALLSRAQLYRWLKLEVCVSKHDQTRLGRLFPLFRHKIGQLYHSLLPADAMPLNVNERRPVVLCIGTIGGRKAQPNLVEAFARIANKHPKWDLELIGRVGVPEDFQKIQHCITTQGLAQRVRLPGWLSDEETMRRMQTSSIIAIPSLQEGLGLSLQEALFYGCVGVGSRAGGIPELIEHEVNGLLVQPGDIAALSAALDRLISDAPLLEMLRSQSRPSIVKKEMTAEAMVGNYIQLYSKLLLRQTARMTNDE